MIKGLGMTHHPQLRDPRMQLAVHAGRAQRRMACCLPVVLSVVMIAVAVPL